MIGGNNLSVKKLLGIYV